MHHVSYEDLLDSDNIMPVCRTCHKQCHDVSELKGINILQATKIVKKENKPKYKKMKRKKAGIEPQKMSRVAYHKALARKQGLLTNKRGEIVDKWGKTIQ